MGIATGLDLGVSTGVVAIAKTCVVMGIFIGIVQVLSQVLTWVLPLWVLILVLWV